jgi:hypothetical protein
MSADERGKREMKWGTFALALRFYASIASEAQPQSTQPEACKPREIFTPRIPQAELLLLSIG